VSVIRRLLLGQLGHATSVCWVLVHPGAHANTARPAWRKEKDEQGNEVKRTLVRSPDKEMGDCGPMRARACVGERVWGGRKGVT
jgi:hypothetical protein